MTKVRETGLVGVPLSTPVLVLKLNPAGSVPLRIASTYGEVPPVALTVCE